MERLPIPSPTGAIRRSRTPVRVVPSAPVRWHHDGLVSGGMSYATRHPVPHEFMVGDFDAGKLMGLTRDQMLHSVAAHELGHALVWLVGGLHVAYASIIPSGDLGGHSEALLTGVDDEGRIRLIGVVAGERAEDRWLREAGLWTPERAVVVEMSASGDRAYALERVTPRPTFGTGEGLDYAELHDMADAELDRIWDRLTATVPLLVQRRELSGEQLAAHTGLPLPTRR